MRFGLEEKLIESFCKVFSAYPEIEEAILYGSRAKGNFREGSDIDLSLKGKKITEDIRAQVWLDLDELNTPYLVDLSIFHYLDSKSLLDHINRMGRVFYKKETAN